MTHTLKTTQIWHDSVGNECECAVIVEYDHYPGFAGSQIDPPYDAYVEVTGVTAVDGRDIPDAEIDLAAFAEDCMAGWIDRDEDARERAAEMRAEMNREDRW